MEKFEINILGCGSALPTTRHFPSCQVINFRDKLFMIDCGEAAQLQFRKSKIKFSRLNHIFISHLHGDHCFGLMGLISTFALLGRTATLHLYSHKDLIKILQPQLDYFCKGMSYDVEFHEIDPTISSIIYEDRSLIVRTIPLKHRIPTCGFLFEEKPALRHINREMMDMYKIPLAYINCIKNGYDFITEDGEVIANEILTFDPERTRKYAYCSDTIYNPSIIELIKECDLLFHEATFAESEIKRAQETFHSTAKQAATIAKDSNVGKLIIGHFSARYEDEQLLLNEAKTVFKNTILAKENFKICL